MVRSYPSALSPLRSVDGGGSGVDAASIAISLVTGGNAVSDSAGGAAGAGSVGGGAEDVVAVADAEGASSA